MTICTVGSRRVRYGARTRGSEAENEIVEAELGWKIALARFFLHTSSTDSMRNPVV